MLTGHFSIVYARINNCSFFDERKFFVYLDSYVFFMKFYHYQVKVKIVKRDHLFITKIVCPLLLCIDPIVSCIQFYRALIVSYYTK